ncbi:aldo/keto reductase [Thermoflexus sp.]|uniref:aldo/keto reductase n=1 Tax=Thermoflexus sp. TaxID=1969742 RepID=UPI0035E43341
MIPGWATSEGTRAYGARFQDRAAPGHFRPAQGLWLSSIGIGTYLGHPDPETDTRYVEAIVCAVTSGCNVIDTAINYRFQRSERCVGEALRRLFAHGFRREELVIATKGGYVPYEGDWPADPRRYIEEVFLQTGIARPEDFVNGHCIAPGYLRHQLEQSRRNLGLETIDVYFIHNPEEQLAAVSREEFPRRLRAAFAALEEAAAAGWIRFYGTATWTAYRAPAPEALSLAEVEAIAREVGGQDHRFRFVQLPYNLAMPEAALRRNQRRGEEWGTVLEVAEDLGITVWASASLMQGRLLRSWPLWLRRLFPEGLSEAQSALQFVRSTPGITTALVGMSRAVHVEHNLTLIQHPPMASEAIRTILNALRTSR